MKMQNAKCKMQKLKYLSSLFCLLLTAYCLLLFTGCASSMPEVKEGEVKEKATVKKISVAGDGKTVLIEASVPITYTAFKLTDPVRLVIDMPDVDVSKAQPIVVNNEFINTIIAVSYEEQTAAPIGRVVIGLKEGIGHEIKLEENRIMVSLNYEAAPAEEGAQAAEGKPAEIEPLQKETARKEEPPAITPAVGEEKEAKKADRLIKVEANRVEGGTLIKIIGNGMIGNFNSFTMDKPARLVVDIWNVANAIPERGLSVGGPHIKRVRIGEHPDKVRLVFDSAQKKVAPYTVERFENSLVITAGTVKIEKPEAPAAINAIDFTEMKDNGRLTIASSKKVAYRLYKPLDEMSLALDIQDAVMPGELKRTLDTSDLNTTVASISSFQPSEKGVRIIVRLKEKTAYDIKQEGDKIWLDFPFVSGVQQAAQRNKETKPIVKSEGIKETKPAEDVLGKEGGQ